MDSFVTDKNVGLLAQFAQISNKQLDEINALDNELNNERSIGGPTPPVEMAQVPIQIKVQASFDHRNNEFVSQSNATANTKTFASHGNDPHTLVS